MDKENIAAGTHPRVVVQPNPERLEEHVAVVVAQITETVQRPQSRLPYETYVLRRVLRLIELAFPDTSSISGGPSQIFVESVRGAVPVLPRARFPGPLAAPGVRVSTHRALHGSCRQAGLGIGQGVGILLPR